MRQQELHMLTALSWSHCVLALLPKQSHALTRAIPGCLLLRGRAVTWEMFHLLTCFRRLKAFQGLIASNVSYLRFNSRLWLMSDRTSGQYNHSADLDLNIWLAINRPAGVSWKHSVVRHREETAMNSSLWQQESSFSSWWSRVPQSRKWANVLQQTRHLAVEEEGKNRLDVDVRRERAGFRSDNK